MTRANDDDAAARSSPGASWIARLLRAPVRRARRRAQAGLPGSCARRCGALVAGRKLDCPAPRRRCRARSAMRRSWRLGRARRRCRARSAMRRSWRLGRARRRCRARSAMRRSWRIVARLGPIARLLLAPLRGSHRRQAGPYCPAPPRPAARVASSPGWALLPGSSFQPEPGDDAGRVAAEEEPGNPA